MAVKIGHASIDENRKAKDGVAGDQTGKEVCVRDWYNKPWTCVIRAKAGLVAEKIAKAMEQACANNHIGYDQGQRTTLFTKAQEAGWDLSKITADCECDCSSLVSVCVNAAGVSVSKHIYTGNEKEALSATGAFEVLTAAKYVGKQDNLIRGDILLGTGHTAVVLSDGGGETSKKEEVCSMNLKELSKGCKGNCVKALQILLIGYSHSCGNCGADGSFGPDTAKAVKEYQQSVGLDVDGIVGPKTWAKLLGV